MPRPSLTALVAIATTATLAPAAAAAVRPGAAAWPALAAAARRDVARNLELPRACVRPVRIYSRVSTVDRRYARVETTLYQPPACTEVDYGYGAFMRRRARGAAWHATGSGISQGGLPCSSFGLPLAVARDLAPGCLT